MDEIKSRLGYRLVMKSGTFSNTASVGGVVAYSLTVQNTGYAAPTDPLYMELILRQSITGRVCTGNDKTIDARKWYGGKIFSISGTARLPNNMPAGTYDLLFTLLILMRELGTVWKTKLKLLMTVVI